MYVNDAFGTAHRAHASTAIIAKFFNDRICGYVMQAELDNANKILEKADKPFTAIMGGAKISDKILIIERLLDKVDNLIIGGGMSYTFAKALGGNIGTSLLEADKVELAKTLIEKAKTKGVNLILPIDTVVADKFDNNAATQIAPNRNIPDGWMGLDIGPESQKSFSEVIDNSKTLLWNGPMGVFEMPSFEKGTVAVAKAVVNATKKVDFLLSAVVILLLQSTTLVSEMMYLTFLQVVVRFLSTWKAKCFQVLLLFNKRLYKHRL